MFVGVPEHPEGHGVYQQEKSTPETEINCSSEQSLAASLFKISVNVSPEQVGIQHIFKEELDTTQFVEIGFPHVFDNELGNIGSMFIIF
jgi:hypothetical protein